MMIRKFLLAALVASGGLASPAFAQDVQGFKGVDLWRLPALARAEQEAGLRALYGDIDGATGQIASLIRQYPEAGRLHLANAVLLAFAEKDDEAFDALARAISLGTPDIAEVVKAPPLNRIAGRPDVEALLAAAPAVKDTPLPPPTRVDNGLAKITRANTGWSMEDRRLVAGFDMLRAMRRYPVADGELPAPLALLQTWVGRGRASGNVGDLYDNRDDGHSPLPRRKPTQISHIVYSDEAKAAGLHYALNTGIMFNRITIGNSSLARTGGPFWRSMPRIAMTTPGGIDAQAQLYAANHLYVFPENADHDPRNPPKNGTGRDAKPGNGDTFPANTPYMLISQGSSRSDQPLLQAVAAILAAFPIDVKEFLREKNLAAPMMQQVFRHAQKDIGTDADYLSPKAHPVVFDGSRIDLMKAVTIANALKKDEIPPMARIRVLAESGDEGGIPGLLGEQDHLKEGQFDSPSAAARLWRGAGYTRRFLLSAEDTSDPNGRPLKFHWIVTQGDPAAVNIKPVDKAGARVEVTMRWTNPSPTALRPDIDSPRVDIAVIADNGANLSAPAFFSMLYPAYQNRVYETPKDAPERGPLLMALDHTTGIYADPLIWPKRTWSDQIRRDSKGQILGWTRTQWGHVAEYSAHGLRIREKDESGRPLRAEWLRYNLAPGSNGVPTMTIAKEGEILTYSYSGPDDLIGIPVPEAKPASE